MFDSNIDEDGARRDRARSDLAQGVSKLAFEVVDITGLLAGIDAKTAGSVSRLTGLRSGAEAIGNSVAGVTESLDQVEVSTEQSVERAQTALSHMKESGEMSRSVAAWVQDLGPRMKPMSDGLTQVRGSAGRISEIATEINMLAINARIEAARAGEEGRGFSVVADAIGLLSKQTAEVTKAISQEINTFGETIAKMIEEAEAKSSEATETLDLAARNDADVGAVAETLGHTSRSIRTIAAEARRAGEETAAFQPVFAEVADLLEESASDIHQCNSRLDGLADGVERLVQLNVATGARTEDNEMIEIVSGAARRIGASFEEAIASGRIGSDALFDTSYRPIPGTDPEQVMTRFTELTDDVLPPIQEPILDIDSRIVFCAAVDRNGYLPTHNLKFSQPQGEDPVWNAAHSRNRRIFDDRVGGKAGRSTSPFLLQVYRRDMGGGKTVLMKDLSAPIMVRGKHWGGLRLAYKPN